MMDKIISKLDYNKVNINWNKNPIKMDLFLSFLTIRMTRSRDHLGSTNGWTQLHNDEIQLVICGAFVRLNDVTTEMLDSIQYKKKLQNQYNNYCNPFYLFDIMNDEGKKFFLNYYKEDIDKLIAQQKNSIKYMAEKIKTEKEGLKQWQDEIKSLKNA